MALLLRFVGIIMYLLWLVCLLLCLLALCLLDDLKVLLYWLISFCSICAFLSVPTFY